MVQKIEKKLVECSKLGINKLHFQREEEILCVFCQRVFQVHGLRRRSL